MDNYLLLYLLLFPSFLFSLGFAQTPAPPAIYVFGDSLVDVGNNNRLVTLLKADFPHNGIDFAGGKPTGRFSNGKNAADFLYENLGLESAPPFLAIASSSDRSEIFPKGVNFASAGAGILDSTNNGKCLSLNNQIDYFSAAYAAIEDEFGAAEAQDCLAKSLIAIVIGSNDILGFLNSNSKAANSAQQFISSLISTLQIQIKKMYNIGARKFVLVGTGPVGCCPAQRSQVKNGDCNAAANAVSDLYNQAAASLLNELKSELTGMSYSFFNTTLAFLQLIQNPSVYGFTEVRSACCGLGNLNGKVACTPISAYCSNRMNYVFWDYYHPTETAAGILIATAVDGAAPLVYPVNVCQLAAL